jgi:signal transduction histidine kinase
MRGLEKLLRPTLARRVILTLLLASGPVWMVLVAYYYWQEAGQQAFDVQQSTRGEVLTAALAQIDNVAQARTAAAFYSDLVNRSIEGKGLPRLFLLQLEDRTGQRLYVSPEAGPARLHGAAGGLTDLSVNGKRYRMYQGETLRWRILIGEPELDKRWLLARLSSSLAISVLLAFPFVLLAAWLAVTRGLRPLRRLSATIAARGPDDLAPVGFVPRYGELAPVTAALDRLLDRLRARVEREHAFVQDAAHELRTPLAVISAQSHVLEKAAAPAERRLASDQLQQAIARASHLIQQLLALASVDGAGAINRAACDVAQLVRRELAAAAPGALAREVDLSLDAPSALFCTMDAQMFASIVQNLLWNALRYVQEGGRVVVELGADGEMLTLAVADNGPGIAEAERALVFDRFYRVAGSDVSGSGLGLAIVAQAVARLRGTVRLDRGLDARGCRFVVELPAQLSGESK